MTEEDDLDEKTVDLCSIALVWMFTTSNRYLRDRATKALVSLLTGRLDATTRLIDRFADVDDPYVAERIYAVAYGVVMRSHDAIEVGRLASKVYEKIFANTPPVHILLRDYARGVIERAIYLGSDIEIDESLIRPPYKSNWPQIPDEEKIQPLMSDSNEDPDNRDWAKRNIVKSVMLGGDFARYVIGTNSHITNWLSLHLDEDPWRSIEAREKALRRKLSDSERLAWEKYENADIELKISPRFEFVWVKGKQTENQNTPSDEEDKIPITDPEIEKPIRWGYPIPPEKAEPPENDPDTEQAEQRFENALKTLKSTLTEEHLAEFEAILEAKSEDGGRRAPCFDLSLIQRYVLWRVFDLGWTTKRFSEFDQSVAGRWYGREASKPERIGKKYQWIAYHEILAYIADHYQYRESSDEDGSNLYKGPWQEYLRDIDPSCPLLSTPSGTSWDSHSPSWWAPVHYENWDEDVRHWDWIEREDDRPDVLDLLSV